MKRFCIIFGSCLILAAAAYVTADQMGIVGELFAGRSGVTRGYLSLHNGASGNTPAYCKIESCDGTYQYFFADNDGGFRYHTAVPTADSDGTAFALSADSIDASHLADADWGDISISSGVASLDADVVAPAEMADGDFGAFTFSGGVASLDGGSVGAAQISDADHGDFTYAGGQATLDNDVVAPAEMADADHGDFTYSGGSATLDADVVAVAEMADADHGDISWSSGVASVDADTLDETHFADSDWGDMSVSSGSVTLDADVVAPAEMADADHGDFTYSSGSATLDADVVAAAEMADADHGDVAWSSGVASVEHVPSTVVYDVNSVTTDIATFTDATYYICDSSVTQIQATLADGTTAGEVCWISCKTAGNNIDITVEHHVTSDPEIIRLDTAKEWVHLVWDGTDWVEISGNGQTYP